MTATSAYDAADDREAVTLKLSRSLTADARLRARASGHQTLAQFVEALLVDAVAAPTRAARTPR
jgi:hypothetical protein